MIRRVDTWAGLLCVLIGFVVLWQASTYSIGTLGDMGPGFYPAALGALLALVGAAIAVCGSETAEEDPLNAFPATAEWRGRLCIVAGIVIFIASATRLGMVIATFGCVFVAALGDRRASVRGSLVLALSITAFGAVLFRLLLGVALPLWP